MLYVPADLEIGMKLIDPCDGLFPSAKIVSITGNYIFTDATIGGTIYYNDPTELFQVAS